eukprot:GILK01007833.1.p1 GENE.GILK01007833.1~~GILK01007833.1.p1  ORF type:complete len:696 (+),score=138.39 GILK01007833.1:36-2123(+)
MHTSLHCDKVVFLLLPCPSYAASSGVDISSDLKGAKVFSTRTVFSHIVEGVSEYLRIVFDLFPNYKVNDVHLTEELGRQVRGSVFIGASNGLPTRVNGFVSEEQCLSQLMRRFADVELPTSRPVQEVQHSSVAALFESAFKHIRSFEAEKGALRPIQWIHSPTQLIVICEDMDGDGPLQYCGLDLKHLASSMNEEGEAFPVNYSLSLFKLNQKSTHERPHQLPGLGRPEVSSVSLPASLLAPSLFYSCVKQFNLRQLRVTGIPMKEAAGTGQRVDFDVLLLHQAGDHIDVNRFMHPVTVDTAATSLWSDSDVIQLMNRREVVLQWKPTDKKMNMQKLECRCIHRLTVKITSHPATVCLVKHLAAGKAASLSTANRAGSSASNISHVLLQHNNQVFLHCLHTGPLNLGITAKSQHQLAAESFVSSFGKRRFRLKEFQSIMQYSALDVARPVVSEDPQSTLNRLTGCFALLEEHALLWNHSILKSADWKNMLAPFIGKEFPQGCFLTPTITDETVVKAVKRASKLYEHSLTLKQKGSPVDGSRLWMELVETARCASCVSPQHRKLYEHIRGIEALHRERKEKEASTADSGVTRDSEKDALWTEMTEAQELRRLEERGLTDELPASSTRKRQSDRNFDPSAPKRLGNVRDLEAEFRVLQESNRPWTIHDICWSGQLKRQKMVDNEAVYFDGELDYGQQ